MNESNESPMLEFCLKGKEEPLWAFRDSNVPLPDDLVSIEEADGTTKTYKVEARLWFTAKQGAHNFLRIRLLVKEEKPGNAQVFL